MLDNFIPLVFCIGLAGAAISAWMKSEKKYQLQRDKILGMMHELKETKSSMRRLQSTNSSSNASEKGEADIIKKIAIILDATTTKTDQEKKIAKLIKQEHSDIAMDILTKQASPQKRDKNEAKAMFKNMKKEM